MGEIPHGSDPFNLIPSAMGNKIQSPLVTTSGLFVLVDPLMQSTKNYCRGVWVKKEPVRKLSYEPYRQGIEKNEKDVITRFESEYRKRGMQLQRHFFQFFPLFKHFYNGPIPGFGVQTLCGWRFEQKRRIRKNFPKASIFILNYRCRFTG